MTAARFVVGAAYAIRAAMALVIGLALAGLVVVPVLAACWGVL